MTTSRPTARSFLSAPFLACAIVLVAAVVGMRPALGRLETHFAKEAIGVRRSLNDFNINGLPSFRFRGERPPFQEVDAPEWLNVVFDERAAEGGLEQTGAVLFVTYYSDPRTQIPHTPEVCYRQGGAVVSSIRTVSVETPNLDVPQIDARLLDIEVGGREQTLLYTFCTNGRFYHDRERVRWSVGMPGDAYTYFSKVEVIARRIADDPEASVERCKRLLAEAVGVLVDDHYPTREQVRRKSTVNSQQSKSKVETKGSAAHSEF